MRWGVVLALLAGVIAAVYLVWSIGFDPVWDAVARAGFGGLALLCLYSAVMFISLAFAWYFLMPPAERSRLWNFYIARLVRDSIAEISPFSPVGGMVASARLMILKRMTPAYAAGSVAADTTTEAMAQMVFLAFGLGIGLTQFRNLDGAGPLTLSMIIILLLAVPGIALLIFLQKRGAGFAERIARKFFPQMQQGVSFHQAIVELYSSPSRLAASAGWHLVAWIGSGVGTFIAFRLVGGEISLLNAIALEALLCTLRSIAAPVPAGIGVQEWGYAMLAPQFGMPAEMGLAVSLLKRAREIVLGVPALLYWQAFEGRAAWREPQRTAGDSNV